MNRTQKIGLGLAVLAALSYGAYTTGKKDQQTGFATKDTKKAELPEIKGSDDVDKLVLTNADKGEVVLEKKADKWEVTKPIKAPANQANVKSLIDNMKELKVSEQIEANATEETKKSYQLDAAKVVRMAAYKGADKKVDNLFGKSGGRGQVMMVDGKPGVFIASGYSSYLYTREVKNWRDQEMFKFDDANVTQLTIDKKGSVFSFTKADKWAGTFKGTAIADMDEEKVKDAVRAFKSLNADDFGDGKAAAETGLDAPESIVTIALKETTTDAGVTPPQKLTLKVGKTSTGSNRYAQKEGDPTIYIIASFAADWATAELPKFQKAKGDAGAPGKDVAKAPPMGMPMGMPGMPPGMPPGHPSH